MSNLCNFHWWLGKCSTYSSQNSFGLNVPLTQLSLGYGKWTLIGVWNILSSTYQVYCLIFSLNKRVPILGIDNEESQIWMFSQSATAKAGKEVKIVSWIHSHVRGNKCFFSSVDVHTQLSMNFLFPQITGIVVEIGNDGQCIKYDSYSLTHLGEKEVKSCARSHSFGSELHNNCSNQDFYH